MEIAVLSDSISSIAYSAQSLGFSNFLLKRPYNTLSLSDTSSDQPPSPPFHVSAASPPSTRTITRRSLRKTRRVKRKIVVDDVGDVGDDGRFFDFNNGGDFNSGGGYNSSGGGGGKGWNFGGYGGNGGSNWEEFSDNSVPDPAFDVVYEVLCWIAMSNCLHFAYKKLVRIGDREKVQMELTPVC